MIAKKAVYCMISVKRRREVEGTHAAIGADLVKQWEKSPEVVMGIAEHHFETPNVSTWGYIVPPPMLSVAPDRALEESLWRAT